MSGECRAVSSFGRCSAPETSTEMLQGLPTASAPPILLRLSDELYAHWRTIEEEFHALAGVRSSFIAFMCLSLWSTWLPFLEAWDDKWAHVYRRDRHRCQNPVCTRHDATPHHIVFRAHGGGDEAENMVTLCSWCHLESVHRGRIRVEGTARALSWRLGRRPTLEVQERTRLN